MHEMYYATLQIIFSLKNKRNILSNINFLPCPRILEMGIRLLRHLDTYPHPSPCNIDAEMKTLMTTNDSQ